MSPLITANSPRIWICGLLLGTLLATAIQPAEASEPRAVNATAVVGPCVPQAALPRPRLYGLLHSCKGSAVLAGTWIGTLRYYAQGTVGIVSGDSYGRIHERFRGRSDDGRRGELFMSGTYTVEGDTGIGISNLRIDRGSGDFAYATGSVIVEGTMPLTGGPELATIAGSWRPRG